jgi:hypothetical protein
LEAPSSARKPRLYIGAPAFSAAGVIAYEKIRSMGLLNLRGVMFWDGPEGMLNVEGEKDIIAWAKEGLTQG